MAFALSSAKAWSKPEEVPVYGITKQFMILKFTGTSADVAIDLSSNSSTFFTDINNDALETLFTNIRAAAYSLSSDPALKSEQIAPRLKVSSLTTTNQFSFTVANHCPIVTFNAGDGNTAYTIEVEWLLKPGFSGFTQN